MTMIGGLRRKPDAKRIIAGLERLRAQLDAEIPDKNLETTMLLATWNIREFDSPAYGERVDDAYYYLAEVVSRFDLVAVQEVRRDLSALEHLVRILGWPWKFLVTDTTEGKPGNEERMAFLYDSRKVRFTGLAGELVLPAIETKVDGKVERKPVQQVARTPYTAGFKAGWTTFQLATVHILYGKAEAEDPARVEEIKQVATFLAQRADEPGRFARNLVLLGDFNIFAPTDATMKALTDNGWVVPEALQGIPGSNVPKDKTYDQIAVRPVRDWFEWTGKAGVLDFYESVFRDEDRELYAEAMGPAYETNAKGKPRDEKGKKAYYRTYWRTFQMSDHLPMWVEVRIDYSKEYLDGLRAEPDA